MTQITDDIKARFWEKVFKPSEDTTNQCWTWQGGKNSKGYGVFTIKFPETILAHKFVAETQKVKGKGKFLTWICQDKLCMNPRHLKFADKVVKSSDVSEAVKKQIRNDYKKGLTWQELKEKHKVANGVIERAITATRRPFKRK